MQSTESSPPADDERRETFNAMRRLDDEIHGTPPADDVREAVRKAVADNVYDGGFGMIDTAEVVEDIVSGVFDAVEVCLRGTVTDAEEFQSIDDARKAVRVLVESEALPVAAAEQVVLDALVDVALEGWRQESIHYPNHGFRDRMRAALGAALLHANPRANGSAT